MLTVKTIAKPSPIDGMGLFAAEFIPKGTVVWEYGPSVDLSLSKTEVEQLSEPQRSEILGLKHAYISKQTGRYIDCGDDARYVNHSSDPNIAGAPGEGEEICVAMRDIQPGEEITQDYRDFEKIYTGFDTSLQQG